MRRMVNVFNPNVSKRGQILARSLGCIAILSLIPLWASGALGHALTLSVTVWIVAAILALLVFVPDDRLETSVNITLGISATVISITAADIFLRRFYGNTLYHQAHAEYVRNDNHHPLLPRYVADVTSVRTTFGDLGAISGSPTHRVPRTEVFRTDPFGFRNSSDSLHPPYDTVIVGDSFGMGLGSSQDEHWGALLNHRGHSVYNLSMPLTCSAHGAARLSLEIDRLQLAPGATIIAPVYTGNDLGDCTDSVDTMLAPDTRTTPEVLISQIEQYRSRSPIRQLSMRLVHRFIIFDPVLQVASWGTWENILFYKPHQRAARMLEAEVASDARFENLVGGLRTIEAIADAHHAKVLVVSIPTKEEIYGWILYHQDPWTGSDSESGMSQAVKSFCTKHNLSYIDLKPILVAEAKVALARGELLWWRDDSHWSPAGHLAVADYMQKILTASSSPGASSPGAAQLS